MKSIFALPLLVAAVSSSAIPQACKAPPSYGNNNNNNNNPSTYGGQESPQGGHPSTYAGHPSVQGYHAPTYSNHSSTPGNRPTTYGNNPPSTAGNRPPTYGNNHPSASGNHPSTTVKHLPTYESSHPPTYESNHPPTYENHPSTTVKHLPTYESSHPPTYESNHPPTYENHPSTTVNHPPTYESNHPPTYGNNHPSTSGNHPSTTVKHPPTYESNHPSTSGNHPSTTVNHPPTYESNRPPTYENNPPPTYHNQSSTSWAGVNSYYLQAFKRPDRVAVLDAVKAAGLKTVRIFISETAENNKNSGSIYMPDIEPGTVGEWDDTQLEAIDQLMVEARKRELKLVIAMHDRYQLGCFGNDTYSQKFELPAIDCSFGKAKDNDVTSWYTGHREQSDFNNRIKHILEHRNKKIRGAPMWKDLSDYIFAFNVQNEGQGHLNGNIAPVPDWWCNKATFMRKIMGPSKVLIATGGGNEFSNSDIPQNWACKAIDLVNLHSYSNFDAFKTLGKKAVQNAVKAHKLTNFEEFGATGPSKANELKKRIDFFNGLRVPWSPWQIVKPGNPGDYEFWTNDPAYGVVKNGAKHARKVTALQKWNTL